MWRMGPLLLKKGHCHYYGQLGFMLIVFLIKCSVLMRCILGIFYKYILNPIISKQDVLLTIHNLIELKGLTNNAKIRSLQKNSTFTVYQYVNIHFQQRLV